MRCQGTGSQRSAAYRMSSAEGAGGTLQRPPRGKGGRAARLTTDDASRPASACSILAAARITEAGIAGRACGAARVRAFAYGAIRAEGACLWTCPAAQQPKRPAAAGIYNRCVRTRRGNRRAAVQSFWIVAMPAYEPHWPGVISYRARWLGPFVEYSAAVLAWRRTKAAEIAKGSQLRCLIELLDTDDAPPCTD